MLNSARIVCLASACLSLATAAQAADFAKIGPQAPAAQLIAAHGAVQGPILRLVYDSTVPDKARTTVEIGRDYVYVRQSEAGKPDRATLHDYALRRDIAIDGARRSFVNTSMYAMADFRFAEAYNRRVIRGALQAAKLSGAPVHPYFDLQETGIASPDDGPVAFDREHTKTGGLRFVVEGKTAAAYEPSSESLSQEETQGVLRFLRATVRLHPEMLSAIDAGRNLPQEIVTLEGMLDKRTERRWSLVSVERVQGTYPLAADYQSGLAASETEFAPSLKALLPLMLDAVAGRYRGGPRSLADYRAAQADALAKGNVLQHFLLDNEMLLQYRRGTGACLAGNVLHDDCSQQQEIVDKWKADAATMKVAQAFALEKQNPKEAIAQRNEVSRAGLSNAYMLDLWNADVMIQHNVGGDPVALFTVAIKGNPYVGGFYKDLGDAYRYSFQPAEAWLCYDLARALPGGQSSPVVDGISRMEGSIASRNPEFF